MGKVDTVVFDMETTGTDPDTGVLTIGMVAFDSDTEELDFKELVDNGIELKLDIREQLKRGRTATENTMKWWEDQGEEARRVLIPSSDDLSLEQAYDQIQDFFDKNGVNNKKLRSPVTFYCRAPHFDYSILQNICTQLDRPQIIPHLSVRDVRTVIDVLTGSNDGYVSRKQREGFIKHNALHDSANDAIQMYEATLINQQMWIESLSEDE